MKPGRRKRLLRAIMRKHPAIIMFEYLDAKIREYQEMISADPEKVRMQLELIKAENMFIAS
jgi:hypothetical protein